VRIVRELGLDAKYGFKIPPALKSLHSDSGAPSRR
jgi:hypothetical protein